MGKNEGEPIQLSLGIGAFELVAKEPLVTEKQVEELSESNPEAWRLEPRRIFKGAHDY